MRKNIAKFGLFVLAIIGIYSCSDDDTKVETIEKKPTATEFKALETAALENLTQHFTINVSNGTTTINTEKGVSITIDPTCLTKNGNPVSGIVDVTVIEIFNRGNMLVANKPTTATAGTGEKKLLISGGEFYVNASQNDARLETTCGYQIKVPAALSGEADYDMEPFLGSIDSNGELFWAAGGGMEFWVSAGPNQPVPAYYSSFVSNFGWFNCDKFANFPGPFTAISVLLPQGYNNDNSNVFIALNGEPNTLGYLYEQFPIGLNCHIIFVTEADGMFRYAIKSIASLPNNASYIFDVSELVTGTEAQTIAAINALP